jgi:hypothetical protein
MTEKKEKFKKLKDYEMLKVKSTGKKGDPVASSYYDDDDNPGPEGPDIK